MFSLCDFYEEKQPLYVQKFDDFIPSNGRIHIE